MGAAHGSYAPFGSHPHIGISERLLRALNGGLLVVVVGQIIDKGYYLEALSSQSAEVAWEALDWLHARVPVEPTGPFRFTTRTEAGLVLGTPTPGEDDLCSALERVAELLAGFEWDGERQFVVTVLEGQELIFARGGRNWYIDEGRITTSLVVPVHPRLPDSTVLAAQAAARWVGGERPGQPSWTYAASRLAGNEQLVKLIVTPDRDASPGDLLRVFVQELTEPAADEGVKIVVIPDERLHPRHF